MAGSLILAGNSIGNDLDVPQRTLESIKTADLLIFEQDRPARRLLKAAGVRRDYYLHNEHNKQETLDAVSDAFLNNQSVLFSSDQGSPVLADPGSQLTKIAREYGASVKVIPGPSSLTAAISACPFELHSFQFTGFLPRDSKDRKSSLLKIKNSSQSHIILDTPYRLKAVLESCDQVFGQEKELFLALDISGPKENYLYGTAKELRRQIKGEKLNFVAIIK